jgi:CheY-like chemotaxis protein
MKGEDLVEHQRPALDPCAGVGASQPVAARSEPVVLVADDLPALRRLVREALAPLGVRVEEAVDGEEGWRSIQNASRLDLLITDIEMPGVDGIELAKRATVLRPGLPVILVSSTEPEAARRRIGSHPFSFFSKPVTPEALRNRVAELLATSPASDERSPGD